MPMSSKRGRKRKVDVTEATPKSAPKKCKTAASKATVNKAKKAKKIKNAKNDEDEDEDANDDVDEDIEEDEGEGEDEENEENSGDNDSDCERTADRETRIVAQLAFMRQGSKRASNDQIQLTATNEGTVLTSSPSGLNSPDTISTLSRPHISEAYDLLTLSPQNSRHCLFPPNGKGKLFFQLPPF